PQVLAEVLADEVERVVVLGKPTLSRQVGALLARGEVEVVVAGPGPDWADAAGSASLVTRAVTVLDEPAVEERAWLSRWQQGSAEADDLLERTLTGAALSGPSVARAMLAPPGRTQPGEIPAASVRSGAAPAIMLG